VKLQIPHLLKEWGIFGNFRKENYRRFFFVAFFFVAFLRFFAIGYLNF